MHPKRFVFDAISQRNRSVRCIWKVSSWQCQSHHPNSPKFESVIFLSKSVKFSSGLQFVICKRVCVIHRRNSDKCFGWVLFLSLENSSPSVWFFLTLFLPPILTNLSSLWPPIFVIKMTHNNAHALRRVVRTPYYVRHVKRSLKHVRRPWRDTFLVLCAREGAAGSSPPGANFPRRFSTRAKCLQVPSEESVSFRYISLIFNLSLVCVSGDLERGQAQV